MDVQSFQESIQGSLKQRSKKLRNKTVGSLRASQLTRSDVLHYQGRAAFPIASPLHRAVLHTPSPAKDLSLDPAASVVSAGKLCNCWNKICLLNFSLVLFYFHLPGGKCHNESFHFSWMKNPTLAILIIFPDSLPSPYIGSTFLRQVVSPSSGTPTHVRIRDVSGAPWIQA